MNTFIAVSPNSIILILLGSVLSMQVLCELTTTHKVCNQTVLPMLGKVKVWQEPATLPYIMLSYVPVTVNLVYKVEQESAS